MLGTGAGKKVLEAAGFVESRLEQGFHDLHGPMDLKISRTRTSMSFLIAFRKASKAHRGALKHLVHTLHVKQQTGTVVCCGRTTSKVDSYMKVTQAEVDAGSRACGLTPVSRASAEPEKSWKHLSTHTDFFHSLYCFAVPTLESLQSDSVPSARRFGPSRPATSARCVSARTRKVS